MGVPANQPVFDVAKWEAFRHVKLDDVDRLEGILNQYAQGVWTTWRNFAGKTLYQVAEKDSARTGRETQCLQMLRAKLQAMDLVAHQVPRVDYTERVVETHETVQKVIEVPVSETHFHKTLKHVPNIVTTEVPEVLEVPQVTWRDELQVLYEDHVVHKEVPKTTIKEVENIVRTTEHREMSEDVPLDIALPPVERVWVNVVPTIIPKVTEVPGRVEEVFEQEHIEVPHEIFVPKTEVELKPEERIRIVEHPVQNIIEREIYRPEYREEVHEIVTIDKNIVEKIRYVPQFPKQTEWSTGSSTTAVDRSAREDAWTELNLARGENEYRRRRNAELQDSLSRLLAHVEQLRLQVQSSRREREDEERLLAARQVAPRVVSLAPVPVKTDKSFEVDRLVNTPSTRWPHDDTILSSISSPPPANLSREFGRAREVRGDLFSQLDRNGDGVISRSEFAEGMARFAN